MDENPRTARMSGAASTAMHGTIVRMAMSVISVPMDRFSATSSRPTGKTASAAILTTFPSMNSDRPRK